MKKKLTLEQTWKHCLAMWKRITKKVEQNTNLNVGDLKEEWMKKHPRFKKLLNDCFFCEYTEITNWGDPNCTQCPGKLVSKNFDCESIPYDYANEPIKFYQKLLELNEKRKTKRVFRGSPCQIERMKKMKKKKYWAGFCNNKIAAFQNLSGCKTVELFTNRKHAKKSYQDVRPVEIRELKTKQASPPSERMKK